MLLRYDPFRELDRVADQAFGRGPAVPMDAVRHGDHVTLRFDLPGVDPASIDLEVERNVLALKAERHWDRGDDDQVLAHERRHGTYSRQLSLGDQLDGSRVEASYDAGVLTVTIPVAETAKPRKVEVASGTAATPIEAEATEAAA
jgi:HSP20 family protein